MIFRRVLGKNPAIFTELEINGDNATYRLVNNGVIKPVWSMPVRNTNYHTKEAMIAGCKSIGYVEVKEVTQ